MLRSCCTLGIFSINDLFAAYTCLTPVRVLEDFLFIDAVNMYHRQFVYQHIIAKY